MKAIGHERACRCSRFGVAGACARSRGAQSFRPTADHAFGSDPHRQADPTDQTSAGDGSRPTSAASAMF